MATPSEILGDPNFHALPVEERRKVMLSVDPQGFGALAPEEQDKVFAASAQRAPQSEANTALAGTGLSVSQPKPPVPAGLGPDQEVSPWRDPTQGYIGQGVRQMGRGIAGLTREGLDPKLEAVSEIARGAGTAAIPAVIGATFPAIAANPVGAAVGLGAAGVAGYGLGKGAVQQPKHLGQPLDWLTLLKMREMPSAEHSDSKAAIGQVPPYPER